MQANEDLGAQIKRARQNQRWSQRRLAEEVDASESAVSMWERGLHIPRNRLPILERVLNTTFTAAAARPDGAPDLSTVSDDDLVDELRQRLLRRQHLAAVPSADPDPSPDAASQRPMRKAARTSRGRTPPRDAQ